MKGVVSGRIERDGVESLASLARQLRGAVNVRVVNSRVNREREAPKENNFEKGPSWTSAKLTVITQ
jgi:hypothetical protein